MSWWLRRLTHPKSNPQQTTPLHRRPVTEPLGDDEEAKCPAGPAADGQIWPEQSPEVIQCLPNTGILCDQNSFWNRVYLSVIDNSWVPKETAKTDNAKACLLPSSFQSNEDQLKAPHLRAPTHHHPPPPQPFSSLVMDAAPCNCSGQNLHMHPSFLALSITTFSLIIKFKTHTQSDHVSSVPCQPWPPGPAWSLWFGLLCPPSSLCCQHSFQLDSLRK